MDEQDRFRRPAAQSYTFEPMTPDQTPPPEKQKGRHSGAFAALLLALILTAGVITWLLIKGICFRVTSDENGVSLRIGTLASGEAEDPSESRAEELLEEPVVSAALPEQNAALPLPTPAEDTRIDPPAAAVPPEIKTSDEEIPIHSASKKELTLQEIYLKIIPCYASVTAYFAAGTGTGSGFIITSDGYIATNCHVISGARSVDVVLEDGVRYPAEIVGSDAVSDLAVLKIDTDEPLPYVELGDSDQLQVGDKVVAIGDPLGAELRGTMTDGIVSAINRDVQVSGRTMTLIQTNAALNEGNSGGPLVNMQGQVIGINTMKISSLRVSVEGLGFAIPSCTAAPILQELMELGYVSGRPALGFEGSSVPAYASVFYGLPQGVYVHTVEEGSDAAYKGLQPGDVITGWNDSEIGDLEDLNVLLNRASAGDVVTFTIYRRGSYYSVEIVLEQAK